MDHRAALAYLERHVNHEAVAGRIDGLSLEPIEGLLGAMGSPHQACPVIHITGTNGKGSVAHMTSALLEAHGLTVGLYTSPHLESVNERIARDRHPVSDDEMASAISEVATAAELTGIVPSYFEILTAAAFGFFAIEAVDVAVVEVGLLGTYDATNVVRSDVAVITNVGSDHTDGTGDWRARIAEEKAGIIKADSRVVLGEDDPDLFPIFSARPAAQMVVEGRDFRLIDDRVAVGGRMIDIETPLFHYEEIYLPVLGTHQAENFAMAVVATELFFDRALDPEVVTEAAATVELPGRAEIAAHHPLILLDGAHNREGAAALGVVVDELPSSGGRIFVVGLLEGRDPGAFVGELGIGPGDLVITTEPPSPRRQDAGEVARAAERLGSGAEVEAVADHAEAFGRAVAISSEDDLVVVAGSLYLVGAIRGLLVDVAAVPDGET